LLTLNFKYIRVTVKAKDSETDKHSLTLQAPHTIANLKNKLDTQIFAYDGYEVENFSLGD